MKPKTPYQRVKSSKFAGRIRSAFSFLPSVETVARRMARATSKLPFIDDVLAMYYCASDSQTPTKIKAAIAATLLYFVIPLDFIPDFLPMLGFGDDMTVLAVLVKYVSDHVTDDHRAKAKSRVETMGMRKPQADPAKDSI